MKDVDGRKEVYEVPVYINKRLYNATLWLLNFLCKHRVKGLVFCLYVQLAFVTFFSFRLGVNIIMVRHIEVLFWLVMLIVAMNELFDLRNKLYVEGGGIVGKNRNVKV